MNRAEALLGTSLESRYRLEVVVTETPDLFVFGGHDVESGAPVVIRMPRALRGMSVEELVDAFDTFAVEAEQLKQLSNASSHVERLLASGEVDGPDRERLAYCVFARTDGSALSHARAGANANGAGLPLARAVATLEPIAAALAAAHDLGVFHGDVRPENMIVVEDAVRPTLKLIRFTLATRLGSGPRTFAPEYGAPEHFKKSFGESGLGPPTDTYGLALCLLELVTGQPPFVGSSTTEFFKQTTDITRRPTLRARGVAVSQEIDAVMARAVAVNPKLRWPTARDFWSALIALSGIDEPAPLSSSSRGAAAQGPISHPSFSVPGLLSPASSRVPIDPHPAIPPPPGSQPNVVPPPPAPARVPLSLKPPSLTGGGALPPASGEIVATTPSIRRLDEGIPDSHAPPAGRISSAKVLVALGVGIIMLAIGGVLIGSVFHRKAAASSANSASSSVVLPTSSTSSSTPAAASVTTPPIAPKTEPAAVAAEAAPEGMIRIPPGTFTMGKDTEGKGDRPQHRVTLTRAFYIDRTEVTVAAYNACMEEGACTTRIIHMKKNVTGAWGCNLEKDRGNHPANCIDRKQASAYCAFVKKRLPTEAEWEYAARGSDERDYPWGTTAPSSCSIAVLSGMTGGCGERRGTSVVGSAPDGASPFGALDMGGNVWEWVVDDYTPYSADEQTDPVITITDVPPESPLPRGILRGGSWDYGAQSSKTTYRLPFMVEAGNASIGVRCARSVGTGTGAATASPP